MIRYIKRHHKVVSLLLIAIVLMIIIHFKQSISFSSKLKIYAAGSGEDMMSHPDTAREIIALSGKANPRVLYIGTATYDNTKSEVHQTSRFVEQGCSVTSLKIAHTRIPDSNAIQNLFLHADIILISGGNTLYAVDRWHELGIDDLIREAGYRGTVLAGGSAGGIVWFDGGHSDSMDPSTYLNPPGPMLKQSLSKKILSSSWAYIRVPGLSLLPGLFCPHYDKIEGNGELREKSFSTMMKMHSGETGVAVDNWAAIVIDGGRYEIISREGKTGSAGSNGQYTKPGKGGKPGAFLIHIALDGTQHQEPISKTGHVSEIMSHAKYIVSSPFLVPARIQNPIPTFTHRRR